MKQSPGSDICLMHSTPTDQCYKAQTGQDRYECMYGWIRGCLNTCVIKGEECANPAAGGAFADILPTRLIDVGRLGLDQPPRLVKFESLAAFKRQQTEHAPAYPGYVTLSYCWGKDFQKTCLLKAELEDEFMRALPPVPKTIRDAIDICRRLGVQYLWVDAICIIQGQKGSTSDWQRESSRVGAYYANAVVTIAAAWSTHNDEGCLPTDTHRPWGTYWRTQVRPGLSMMKKGISWALSHSMDKQPIGHDVSAYAEMAGLALHTEVYPLFSRGWVFQELLLSPRVVWFTKDNVHWRCQMRSWHMHDEEDNFLTPFVEKINSRYVHTWNWEDIVSLYTGLNLSFEDDRLPAISGICRYANADGTKTPGSEHRYLAGLWSLLIEQSLAWSVMKPDASRRELPANVPSWSPFSSGQRVHYIKVEREESCDYDCAKCDVIHCDLVDTDIRLTSDDPYGQIDSAALELQVVMLPIKLDRGTKAVNMCVSGGKDIQLKGGVSFDRTPPRAISTSNAISLIFLQHCYGYGDCTCLIVRQNDDSSALTRLGLFELAFYAVESLEWRTIIANIERRQVRLI